MSASCDVTNLGSPLEEDTRMLYIGDPVAGSTTDYFHRGLSKGPSYWFLTDQQACDKYQRCWGISACYASLYCMAMRSSSMALRYVSILTCTSEYFTSINGVLLIRCLRRWRLL